jgi:transcriptional regulator with XRE-family HTH domain
MSPADLKTLRASIGWSQQRLADEIGVTRNTINRWEMGLHPISLMAARALRALTPRG